MDRESLQESTLALQHFYDIGAVKRRTSLGPIFEATELPFERPIAVWVLDHLAEMGADKSIMDRCEAAAYTSSRLKAPASIRTVDSGRIGKDVPFVVLEDFEGRDLRSHIGIHGPLSVWETLRVVEQLGESAEDAHSRGMNGLAMDANRVIVDNARRMGIRVFGHGMYLSRQELLDLDDAIVDVDLIRHVPPAQFARDAAPLRIPGADVIPPTNAELAGRTIPDGVGQDEDVEYATSPGIDADDGVLADIYTVAAIAYECLAGIHPYFRDDRDVGDGVLAILRESPPELATHFGIDGALAAVVHDALTRAPKYPSVAAFVAAFRSAVDAESRDLADRANRPDWLGPLPDVNTVVRGKKKTHKSGAGRWVVRSLVTVIVLLLVGNVVSGFFAMSEDVTNVAMVPEFAAPAPPGEGVDVVIQTTADTNTAFAAPGEQTDVKVDLYRVSTRGETVHIATTPFVVRAQERGTRLRFVLSAEGYRPRQLDVVVREDSPGAMYITEKLEHLDSRTAQAMDQLEP